MVSKEASSSKKGNKHALRAYKYTFAENLVSN